MSSIDPFAAPNANSALLNAHANAYPVGFYQPIREFNLLRMITSPFKSPNWAMNLLWIFVCELAAMIVVGRIVQFGYLAEVAEARSGGKSENWPDFNLDRFSEYLMRGLWPFLWNIIWSFVLVMVVGIPIAITIGLSSVLTQNGNEVPGTIIGIVGFCVCVFVCLFSIMAMLISMMHSALGNDFMKGADWKWISAFIAKVGSTALMAGILYVITGMVASILGLMLFCVGIMAVGPLLYLMSADLVAQLHDIFVARGGTPAFDIPELDGDIIDAQVVV